MVSEGDEFSPSPDFLKRLKEIPCAPSAKGVETPWTIESFQLGAKLGEGGMGAVYWARDPQSGKEVAIKILKSQDEEFLKRFRREAQNLLRAAEGLESDFFARPLYVSLEGKTPFIVMEYVEGKSLSHIIAEAQSSGNPIPLAQACEYVRQIAVGLGMLHSRSIIHRDIKPSNLICTSTGKIRILDFGIAKYTGPTESLTEATNVTSMYQTPGTTEYMAPELFASSLNLTERSDIYSLGATFYKLLTGCVPFRDEDSARGESMAYSHAHRKLKPIQQLRPDVPDDLAAVIHKMLSIIPAKRYRTAEEVAQAIEPFTMPLRKRHIQDYQLKSLGVKGVFLVMSVAILSAIWLWPKVVSRLSQASHIDTSPGKAQSTGSEAAPNRQNLDERSVAAELIQNGGGVAVAPVGASLENISDSLGAWTTELPADPFWVIYASIHQTPKDGSNLLGRTVLLPHVSLVLFSEFISDEHFASVETASKSLSEVKFVQSKITGRTLKNMAQWPSVEIWTFEAMPLLHDNDLRELGASRKITGLNFLGTGISGRGLMELKALRNLGTLDIRNCPKFIEKDLNFLKGCPDLWSLKFSEIAITEMGMREIIRLQNLSELTLDATQTPTTALQLLQEMVSITDIYYRMQAIDHEKIAAIASAPRLRLLHLDDTQMTDEDLVQSINSLQQASTLRDLSLANNPAISNASVDSLAMLTKLELLNVQGTGITRSALVQLKKLLPGTTIYPPP